jgi:hypothetical protein
MNLRDFAYTVNHHPKFIFQDANGAYKVFIDELLMREQQLNRLINPFDFYNSLPDLDYKIDDESMILGWVMFSRFFKEFEAQAGNPSNVGFFMTQLDPQHGELIGDVNMRKEELWEQYGQDVLAFRREYERAQQEQTVVDQIQRVPYNPFLLEKNERVYTFQYEFRVEHLFDQIELSIYTPFASIHSFYKLLKGSGHTITVPETRNELLFYTNGIEVRVEIGDEPTLTYKFDIDKARDESDFLTHVKRALQITDLVPKASRLNGVYMIPRQDLNLIVWSDMIMNDPLISQTLVRNERMKATTRKNGVFVYFNHANGSVSSIFMSVAEDTIRVKIARSKDERTVLELQDQLSLFLGLYNDRKRDIARFYNAFLVDKLVIVDAEPHHGIIDSRKRIKEIAPHLFLPGYTRRCEYMPKIINDFEVATQQRQVMKFPKDNPTDPLQQQYYFICDHEEHIYPGLRKNVLANKDKFPLLPCCYKTDHMHDPKSLYSQYMEGRQQGEKVTKRHLLSDKFVGANQTGECPPPLVDLFRMLTPTPIVRRGVHRSVNSALECVLYAIDFEQFRTQTELEQKRRVRKERSLLAQAPLQLAKQECWGLELVEIQNYLLNDDLYLNPRLFLHLLEYMYRIRLVVFQRTQDNTLDFMQPNSSNGYIRYTSQDEIVILYEHYGSESNMSVEPQCEMIEFMDPQKAAQEGIYDLYVHSKEYIRDHKFINVVDPLPFTIVAQHLDFFGKLFAVDARIEGRTVTVFADELYPPLEVPISTAVYPGRLTLNELVTEIDRDGPFFSLVYAPPNQSALETFMHYRRQTMLLMMNVKYNASLGQLEFKLGQPRTYTPDFFVEGPVVVPDELTQQRAQYTLDLYKTQHPQTFQQYKEFQAPPFDYQSIQDFKKQPGCLLMSVDQFIPPVPSYTLVTVPKVGVYMELQTILFRVVEELSELHNISALYVPQRKEVYVTDAEGSTAAVAYKEEGVWKTYALVRA